MEKKENWVDCKTIKVQVSMQMVLDKYGIKLKDSGKNHTRGILPEIVKYFGLGLQKKGKAIPNRIIILRLELHIHIN